MNKEYNFVSAVVLLTKKGDESLPFLEMLQKELDEHFMQFEIIVVDAGDKGIGDGFYNWAKKMEKPITLVKMSANQAHEQCMNAGLDLAIGDYVYEFDSTDGINSPDLIWKAYEMALQGSDIISVCPRRERVFSRAFYGIFNAHNKQGYKIRTEAFRLVSRRAINRVHAISENLPYRKAAYAACGLQISELEFDGALPARQTGRMELAIDSLTLYTNFGYRFSIGFTILMFFTTVCELIYTVAIYLFGHPIEGWTTTMFVLTFGLSGVFAVLTIVMKYLTLLLRMTFKKQSYLIRSIEKI